MDEDPHGEPDCGGGVQAAVALGEKDLPSYSYQAAEWLRMKSKEET